MRTPEGRRIWRLELALTLAVIVVLGGIGYYQAVHLEGNQRFAHCTIVAGTFLVLDYYYGSFKDRPVVYGDGRELTCRQTNKMPK